MSLRVDGLEVRALRRRLAAPVRTARGTLTRRDAWLVVARGGGHGGLGEAAPLPDFGTEAWEAAGEALARAAAALAGRPLGEAAAAETLDALAGHAPTARFALHAALADLGARARGLPLAAALAAETGAARPRRRVPVHALLVGGGPEALAAEARRAAEAGAPALKLKVAAGPLAEDLARVRAVRAAVGPRLPLRLDANGGWDEAAAREALRALAPFAPAWLEQPVPAADVEAMARLRREGALPLAADEALLAPDGAARVAAARAADVWVLKPAALGGLDRALALARAARGAGATAVVTSLLDGAVAQRAALHLAAALPTPLPPCGLAPGPALAGDLLDPLRPEGGWLTRPAGPGLGADLAGWGADAERLRDPAARMEARGA